MPSKPVYSRLDNELHAKVKAHSVATGQSLSASIEDLVRRGLGELSKGTLEAEAAEARELIQALEAKLVAVEGERKGLEGQVKAWRTKASLALAAHKHAESLQQESATLAGQIDQLRVYLSTSVAVCTSCRAYLRLYDIGQRRCANCGQRAFDWIQGYQPPPTAWEALREGAAVTGTATVVAALLNAISGGQEDS